MLLTPFPLCCWRLFKSCFSYLNSPQHTLSKSCVSLVTKWKFNFAVGLMTSFFRQNPLKSNNKKTHDYLDMRIVYHVTKFLNLCRFKNIKHSSLFGESWPNVVRLFFAPSVRLPTYLIQRFLQIRLKLIQVQSSYEHMTETITLGRSHENREMTAIKVSVLRIKLSNTFVRASFYVQHSSKFTLQLIMFS